MALCLVTDLKARLRLPETVTEQDDVLEAFLEAAQEEILKLTGFILGTTSTTVTEDHRNVQLGRIFTLRYRPLLPIADVPQQITVQVRDLGSSTFATILGEIYDAQRGRVMALSSDASGEWPPTAPTAAWFKWREPTWPVTRVTYKVDHLGSATNPVPRALRTACVEWAISMYARAGGGALQSLSVENVSETYVVDQPMPGVVQSLLARYIRDVATLVV